MAKMIMVQGTMSNAGKSFLAAGLCRVFKQDGWRVAPFKAQNMALNSFVTKEGLEMGRAQVVQAEAAGAEPEVAMNPILLKPSSQTGSQVIVNGEVLGNYSAEEYFTRRKELMPVVKEALDKLAKKYDIIVIEGAGSPAEINLKENDLANMGIARLAKAPVLLVGDIDRGGVFASLYGTVKLLEPEEQAMIRGIVINKFRGDVSLLKPGLDMIEELLDIPVVGVVPMSQVDIEDEDSLAERLNRREKKAGTDIAVIRLPHLSNFTDFDVFERLEGVSLRYVEEAEELGLPDVVIIPGTKNTMSDLKWMRDGGLAEKIQELSAVDIPVVGICGGFQMLGKRLSDPYGVENKGTMDGLGLLDAKTVFSREKVRTQAKGKMAAAIPGWDLLAGMETEGYEIHMGVTRNLGDCREIMYSQKDGHPVLGLGNSSGTVIGTYLHGFFDAPGMAERFVAQIEAGKRAETEAAPPVQPSHDWKQYREEQYDRLADLVRNSLDMEKVYEILNGGL
ncbi:MAG TPA: cobyric acid synthase [Candidatus Lachnoclostridium stercorigallinarum]|uniref:Cobyric acid synthase n=1 Tax=Candidatus Lachnoclostridium stercorigallinarum TaxID=2838634 RepID=A0A9D2K7I0_9FIRM|nr:cobyric acid synthase [Candidatus Lachnoclostridium stercorigallinarum]